MKLRHDPLVIPKDGSDPFVNCKLDRKKYADVLTSIVSNYADGFVLAINNPWGTGKTTFIKMWKQQLKNEGYETLYFNAWENDYQSEVIIALLAELDELKEKAKEAFDNVLSNTAVFLKKVAPAVLKGAASKAIGNEAVSEIVEAFTEYTTEELEKEIIDLNKSKQAIINFKESLQKFVEKVDNDKPVVFIIDELDRCRPNYAVEVLEQIKHLFSVPGIVFVLSIDKEQLGNAVRGVYGSDRVDADEYLRRFIDLEYSIPKPLGIGIVNYFYEYFDFDSFIKSEQRVKSSAFRDDKTSFIQFTEILFNITDLSLRQQEKLFAHTRLVLNTFKSENYIFPRLLILLIYIKNFHSNIISEIKNKKISTQELINKIEDLFPNIIGDENGTRSIIFTLLELAVFSHNFFNEGLYKKTQLYLEDSNSGEKSISLESKYVNDDNKDDMMMAYESLRYKGINRNNTIKFLLNKIELLDPINIP